MQISHGFDIRSPGGENVIFQVGKEFLPALGKVRDRLRKRLKHIPGSMVEKFYWLRKLCKILTCKVEDNKYSVSAHYRRVPKSLWAKLESIVDEELKLADGKLKKGTGKMVYEVPRDSKPYPYH